MKWSSHLRRYRRNPDQPRQASHLLLQQPNSPSTSRASRNAKWLATCEEDLEHGRDGHQYQTLAPMFAANDCTRIDDIIRMNPTQIRDLSKEMGISASIGLVNRIFQYAQDDVAQVKVSGKLT